MLITLAVLTLLLTAATLLPLWRNPYWLVRGWDFPRLQLFVIAAALVAAQLTLLDASQPISWLLILATVACAVYQAWWILPYTPLYPREARSVETDDDAVRLSLITANVLMTNHNAPALIEQVRRHSPDIVVTLESDAWWEDQLDALSGDYPHRISCPLDNLYGMHVFSRLPLHDTETRFLVDPDAPSMHALVELTTGDRIRVHFLHPKPPSPSENDSSQERDAELVIVARSVAESDAPIIVTGDLNDVAWSRTTRLFRKISKLLDPRVGRGMFNTFHADHPYARWPLDHLFHSRHFRVARLARLDHIGSDHFPLFAELAYHPDPVNPEPPLETDKEDREIADEVTDAEQVSARDVPQPGQA